MDAIDRDQQWAMHCASLRDSLLAGARKSSADERNAIVAGVGMVYVLGNGLLSLMSAVERRAIHNHDDPGSKIDPRQVRP